VGATCGDSIVQSGEQCDDGNTAAGDGCSATCTTEQSQTPKVDISIDKPTITSDLLQTHMITVTLGASGGFSGAVNLTGTVVDANNQALPGWTVAFNTPTVNLSANGNASAVATLTVPSENRGLAGTVKIAASSSLGSVEKTSAVTVANQLTIQMTLTNGVCTYPAAGTINILAGTKVRWLNKAASNITIHLNGNQNGFAHQGDPGSAPNVAYEQTATGAPGAAFGWYCHAPGPTVNNLLLRVVQ
jgi:cysteine-rich repeat protein